MAIFLVNLFTMDWIFWRQENESAKRESDQIHEILRIKGIALKELRDFTTLGSKLASEEELEYWKAHPNCKNDEVHETKEYRYYCLNNLSESVDWCLIKLKELRDPNEIKESRLKLKKNQ